MQRISIRAFALAVGLIIAAVAIYTAPRAAGRPVLAGSRCSTARHRQRMGPRR